MHPNKLIGQHTNIVYTCIYTFIYEHTYAKTHFHNIQAHINSVYPSHIHKHTRARAHTHTHTHTHCINIFKYISNYFRIYSLYIT